MAANQHRKHSLRSRGYALFGVLVTLGVAATVGVTGIAAQSRSANPAATTAALARAKQALISRAASDANHPGSLPCPDAVTNIPGSNVPNDGIADLLAGQSCPSPIGRLPWRTLGLPDLRDADGERLWYIVAPAYQDAAGHVINPATAGQLAGYDCGADTTATPWPCAQPRPLGAGWAAVVLSAGPALASQLRSPSAAADAAQYLESYASGDPYRLRLAAGSAHNDRYAAITPDDLFALAQRRVANEVQRVLAAYYANTASLGQAHLPWPATGCSSAVSCAATMPAAPRPATARGYLPSDDAQLNALMSAQGMAWFDQNQWRATLAYELDGECADGGSAAQCGRAFATRTAEPGVTLIGNPAAAGTRATLSFAGAGAKSRMTITVQ